MFHAIVLVNVLSVNLKTTWQTGSDSLSVKSQNKQQEAEGVNSCWYVRMSRDVNEIRNNVSVEGHQVNWLNCCSTCHRNWCCVGEWQQLCRWCNRHSFGLVGVALHVCVGHLCECCVKVAWVTPVVWFVHLVVAAILCEVTFPCGTTCVSAAHFESSSSN